MWIERNMEPVVKSMLRQFPSVLLTGVRQSGKSATIAHLLPGKTVVRLDDALVADTAVHSPDRLFGELTEPVILDEIQYAPDLFRILKVMIDRDRRPGRFVLTGSQHFELMRNVSESLAGRCGVLNLHTLSYGEAVRAGVSTTELDFIFKGGFPELYAGDKEMDGRVWFQSYVTTYLERDIRNIVNVSDLGSFRRLLRAVAARTGSILDYTSIAGDVGVQPNTAKAWIHLLEESGVVFILEPFYRNIGTRMRKAPKIYVMDTGLAVYLLGFRTMEDCLLSPYAGKIWETYVLNQIVRCYANKGLKAPLFYWKGAAEVDMILDLGGDNISAIECKLTERPHPGDTRGLTVFAAVCAKEKLSLRDSLVACRTASRRSLSETISAVSVRDIEDDIIRGIDRTATSTKKTV